MKIAFITWKLPLLGENFILGLTPSLKTSGMPFFVLPCGRSFSVIRLVICRKNDKLYLKSALCVKNVIERFFLQRIYMVARLLFWIFVFEMNIPICLLLSFSYFVPLCNPSLCEIYRRCVKWVNDMENLPTEDLSFVRSWQAGNVKMKCCIGGHDERSLRLEKIKIL